MGSRRNPVRGRLARLEDFLFASLAFPIGMFVGTAFWGLYAIDREAPKSLKILSRTFGYIILICTTVILFAIYRELVFPTALDKIVPVWVNHILHTT